jgi:peptidyl-prolyl cis-trans isomerase SurA
MTYQSGILAVLWFTLTVGGGAWAETIDRIVAKVNDDIILYSELQSKVAALQKQSAEAGGEGAQQASRIERDVLQALIHERLARQEVKRLNIKVSDRDVDEALENVKKQNHVTTEQFEYLLKQQGKTVQQFRDDIKVELERSRLIERTLKSKIVITEEQLDTFLKSGKVTGKERRRLSVIFLPVPEGAGERQAADVERQAQDLVRRLKEGADFARMVKEHSQGPGLAEGGDIGYVTVDELAPEIERVTRGLGANQLAGPVKAPGGYYILKVVDTQRERVTPGDANVREQARRVLMQQEVGRRFEDWIRGLESRSFIQVFL